MAEPWTDEEIERERTSIRMLIFETQNDPKFSKRALKVDATLRELLNLRAKVARLEHECQTARAERDLARKHLANVNKAAKGKK